MLNLISTILFRAWTIGSSAIVSSPPKNADMLHGTLIQSTSFISSSHR